jgi:Xaa-Pro aminopeptidase
MKKDQHSLQALTEAEEKAADLFQKIRERGLIRPGITEKELNKEIYDLALELFGIRKYWHKRIVRAGANTLHPYHENPPDLMIQEDDILFLDFGPIFDEWEADYGRTDVLGNDPKKLKLQADIMEAWDRGKAFFEARKSKITGAELYQFVCQLAEEYGWTFGNEHCGHLIGQFPHERVDPDKKKNYLCPENNLRLKPSEPGKEEPYWILEIHFIDPELKIGGFTEQILG